MVHKIGRVESAHSVSCPSPRSFARSMFAIQVSSWIDLVQFRDDRYRFLHDEVGSDHRIFDYFEEDTA